MLSQTQRDLAVSIIDRSNDLTIATVRADGYPQATAVSFVNEGLDVYFGTSAHAQKTLNIARDDRVSVSITAPYKTWEDIAGVSIGGRARRIVEPQELLKVGALMFAKFPQVGNYTPKTGEDLALFCIDAEVISILDYRQGFGHTELATV